jgi:ribonuclease P protein component
MKFKEDFLSLRVIRNGKKESRFGFIVSQKVSNKAVLRNKIKRRLRGLTADNMAKIKKGFDVVFLVSPGLEKKDFWEIEEIFQKIFQKANLFNS